MRWGDLVVLAGFCVFVLLIEDGLERGRQSVAFGDFLHKIYCLEAGGTPMFFVPFGVF